MVDFRGSMDISGGGGNVITPEVPIVQPVIDRSGEIMGNALGNAFAAIGGAVKQHRSNLAATSQMNTLNNYRMESLRISNAVAQGQMTPAQANTAHRNLYATTLADNPMIGPDLDTLHAKLLAKGGVSHISVEGTDEYQREKAFADEAHKHGLSVDEYRKQLDVSNALKVDVDELNSLKTAEEKKEFIRRSGIKQKLQKFSETALPAYERDLEAAVAAIDQNPEQAAGILDNFRKEYNKRKRSIQSLAGDMDIDYLFVPFDDMYAELKDYAEGKTTNEVYKSRTQAINERNKFLLMQKPEVAKTVAKNELFKGNVAVLTKLAPETIEVITDLAGEGTPEGYKRSEGLKLDPARDKKESVLNDVNKPKQAADLSKATVDLVKDANANSGDVAKTGAAMKMLDGTVQSVVDNSGIIGTPKQLTSVIETLGDEAVNEMVVREGGVSPATAKAAKEVVRREYEGPFLEAVDEIWEDGQFQETITIDQALKGEGQGEEISKVQVKEVIEPVWTENGVRFEVKPEFEDNKDVHKARAAAERLNTGANSVAKPMNRLIKAQATLEGTSDYKSIYERDYAKRLVPMEDVQGPEVKYPEITEEDFNDLKGMMSPEAVQHYEEQIKQGKMKEKSFFEKADDFAEKILGEPDPESPAGQLIAEDEAKKNKEILEGISKADSANIEMMHMFTDGEGGTDAMNLGTSGGKIVGSTQNGKLNGKPVSQNAVGEIMDSQAKGEAFAVGSIQVIPSTLKQAVAAGAVSKDAVFNEATQAKIFEYLVTEKRPKLGSYINGESDDYKSAMLEAAKEFASWPDPRTGRSYYWKSGNKAQMSKEEALTKLVELRKSRVGDTAVKQGKGLAALDRGGSKKTTGNVTYRHPEQTEGMMPKLKDDIASVADELGLPLEVTSGYRSPSVNASAGGAKKSAHMSGKAADISIDEFNTEQRVALIRELRKRGVKRFGIYSGNTALHIDYGTAGLGKKNAHFMFDKTNRNMGKAPAWFRALEKEFG